MSVRTSVTATPANFLAGAVAAKRREQSLEKIFVHRISTWMGVVELACSQVGVCGVGIIGSQSEPDDDDHHRGRSHGFRHAQFVRADDCWLTDNQSLVQSLQQLCEAWPRSEISIPLDIRGTVFQRRVWAELQKIPCGVTTSYSQIALQIGSPLAVRAVASACAANQLALIIPCHRVLRRDGSLSGYRWGLGLKDQLLTREQES